MRGSAATRWQRGLSAEPQSPGTAVSAPWQPGRCRRARVPGSDPGRAGRGDDDRPSVVGEAIAGRNGWWVLDDLFATVAAPGGLAPGWVVFEERRELGRRLPVGAAHYPKGAGDG